MTSFETKVCSRCGGSGQFSFNPKDGTMCYGCKGTGKVYTKRGLVAKQMFEDSMCTTADQVKVGDNIRCLSISKNFQTVIEVIPNTMPDGTKSVQLVTKVAVYHCRTDHKIRVGAKSTEEKAAKLAAALEFQATLTEKGKPAKKNNLKKS